MNDHEITASVHGHPGYIVTNRGRVIDEYRPREVTQSASSKGPKVNLRSSDGHANTFTSRLVSVLVAEAFVPQDPRFTTVVHLDNDSWNCRADNLVWRTRSYARRYKMQFSRQISDDMLAYPVEDEEGQYFGSIVDAGMRHGLCWTDVLRSVEQDRPVPLIDLRFNWA